MTYFKWQDEHIKFLKENANDNTLECLTQYFNDRFETNRTKASLKSKMYKSGIKLNNNTGRFKKGENTYNTHKIGHKSVDNDGYVIIKHSNSNKGHSKNWKLYHHYLWEQEHGKIPENHVIIFLNGNKRDFRMENLFCVEWKTWLKVINNDMRFDDPELVKSAIHLCRLMLKQKKIEKRIRK